MNAMPDPIDPERQSAIAKAAAMWGKAAIGEGANAYSPTGFYTQATDFRGHGERLSFKVKPELYVQIMQMVADDDFPDYTMPADVARDAIVHLLAMRREQVKDFRLRESLEARLREVAFNEFAARMAGEVDFWETIHENVRTQLARLAQANAWGQINEYLTRAEELADPCPEPYRSSTFVLINEWRQRVPAEYRT